MSRFVLHLVNDWLIYWQVLWRCWLGGRKGIRPVKKLEWWGAGIVICLERGADLHLAQRMPLPLTVSCFSKIQIGFTFLVPAHLGSPGQRAVKRVCVCVLCPSSTSAFWTTQQLSAAVFFLHNNAAVTTRTRFGERGFSYCGPAIWNTLPSGLHDITDTGTFRKWLKSVLHDRAYLWLLLALLDVSYSDALRISRRLIEWLNIVQL